MWGGRFVNFLPMISGRFIQQSIPLKGEAQSIDVDRVIDKTVFGFVSSSPSTPEISCFVSLLEPLPKKNFFPWKKRACKSIITIRVTNRYLYQIAIEATWYQKKVTVQHWFLYGNSLDFDQWKQDWAGRHASKYTHLIQNFLYPVVIGRMSINALFNKLG